MDNIKQKTVSGAGLSSSIFSIDEINNITDDKETKHKVIKRPKSFDNARLPKETWEAYKERRIQFKKWMKQVKFFKSHGEKNRTTRRKRNPLRLTKPLKKVRNKWMIGNTDVTFAIKNKIPLHYYLRVIHMGLDVNKLTEMGKELSEELRKDGVNSNTNTK